MNSIPCELNDLNKASLYPPPIENEQNLLVFGYTSDLLHNLWKNLGKVLVQGSINKEQSPSARVVNVDVALSSLYHTSFRVPAFRQWSAAAVTTKMSVDIVGAFPNRLQFHKRFEKLVHHDVRFHPLRQRRYLCSQRLHARNISQAQEHSEISSQGCFESLDGAQLKSESERYGTHYLFHTQLRLAYQSAHFFEHRPKSYFTQRYMQKHRSRVLTFSLLRDFNDGRSIHRLRRRCEILLRHLCLQKALLNFVLLENPSHRLIRNLLLTRNFRSNRLIGLPFLTKLPHSNFEPRRHLQSRGVTFMGPFGPRRSLRSATEPCCRYRPRSWLRYTGVTPKQSAICTAFNRPASASCTMTCRRDVTSDTKWLAIGVQPICTT